MKRNIRGISFTPQEGELVTYLDSKLNRSKYMKRLILEDLKRNKNREQQAPDSEG